MWKRKFRSWVYRDAAAGEGGGGAAGAAGAATAATGGDGGAAGATGATGTTATEPSLLAQAAATSGAATGAAATGATSAASTGATSAATTGAAGDPLAWIPEKYRVPGAEGKIDIQASAMKINEARATLEKRMGEGGMPPETADAYKPDAVLATLKEKTGKDVTLPPELLKDFNAFALDAKLTQPQYEKQLSAFMGGMTKMIDAAFDNAMATGKAELTKAWGAPEGDRFKAEMGQAYKAFNTYMPKELATTQNMDAIGNNPMVLQLLANIGRELKEDKLPAGDNAAGGDEINKLMNSQPYWDAKHPEHASTVAKVNEHFAKGGKRPG